MKRSGPVGVVALAAAAVFGVVANSRAAAVYDFVTDNNNGLYTVAPNGTLTLSLFLRETLTGGSPSDLVSKGSLYSGGVRIRRTGTPSAPAAITAVLHDANFLNSYDSTPAQISGSGGTLAVTGGNVGFEATTGTPLITDSATVRRVRIGQVTIQAGLTPLQTSTFTIDDRPGTDTIETAGFYGTAYDSLIVPRTFGTHVSGGSGAAQQLYFTGATSNIVNTATNFATDAAGTQSAATGPGGTSWLNFASTNAVASRLNASLNQDLEIGRLTFGTGAGGSNPVTIGGTSTLSLNGYVGNGALGGTAVDQRAGSAAVTINAPVAVVNDVGWQNNSAAALTVNGQVNLYSSKVSFSGSGNQAFNGAIVGAGGLVSNATGTITLAGPNTYSGVTTIAAGTVKASVAGGAANNLLTDAGGVDLGNSGGKLVLDYTGTASPAATVRSLLTTANGNGFAAAANPIRSTGITAGRAIGYSDNGAGWLTVRVTLRGDADLDGGVSINDFNALASNFGKTSGKVWTDGDFDYDGGISINDFNLLAGGFGQSFPASAEMWTGLLAFAAAHDDLAAFAAVTGVPEPSGLAMLAFGGAAVLRRRRR